MRLNSIKLANFRGFLDENEISFGPHLTVLFGRNGFGKTTLIDAFEWLLHGQILRYLGDEEGRRGDYIKHVDAREEPYVEISIRDREQNWVLRRERRSKDRSELRVQAVGGSWMSQHQAHEFLSRIDGDIRTDPGKGHVFSEPFVAYHLLGQQSIQAFVQADPRERYDRLAPIIGVDRYVKLTEALLQSRRALLGNLEEIDRAINKKKEDVSALQRIVSGALATPENQLGIKAPASQEWLANQFGIIRDSAPSFLRERLPQSLPQDFVGALNTLDRLLPTSRFWISAREKELEDRLASLQELERSLKAADEMNHALTVLVSKVEGSRNSYEALAAILKEKDQATREVEQSLNQVGQTRQQIAKDQAASLDLTRLQTSFDSQSMILQSLQTESNTNDQLLVNLQNTAMKYRSLDQKLRGELQGVAKNSSALASSIALVESLILSLMSLATETTGREDIGKSLTNQKAELAGVSAELLELEEGLRSLEVNRMNATERMQEESKKAQAYQNILAQIRRFIESDECPVCSTRFESREALLQQIDSRLTRENPDLSSAARELNSYTSRIEDLRRRIDALRANRQVLDSRLQNVSTELDKYDARLAEAKQQAISVGVFLSTDLNEDAAKLMTIADDLKRQKSSLDLKGQDLIAELRDAQSKLQRASEDLQEKRLQSDRLSANLAEVTAELEKLDNRRLELGRSLGLTDLSPQAVTSKRDQLAVSQTESESAWKAVQERLVATRDDLKNAQENLAPYSSQQNELIQLKSQLSRLQASNRERASSLGLDLGAIESFRTLADNIVSEIALISESKRLFDEFSGSVGAGKRKLELDEQNRRLTVLQADLASLERNRTALANAQRLTSDLAEKVRKAGEDRTQRILASSAKLAENYYNRIYPHPLWSRLDIGVDEDTSRGRRAQLRMVAHRIGDRSKTLSAVEQVSNAISIKYSFSTGQLNLFAISLVLSLAQQRGNELLSTLLLDDPVQAMDDMRVAELCWVLLQLSRNRQIVVATGNENFVELLFNRAAPIVGELSIVAHLFQAMTSRGPLIQSSWRTTSDANSTSRVA